MMSDGLLHFVVPRPSPRSDRTASTVRDVAVRWPSGEGEEIYSMVASLEEVIAALRSSASYLLDRGGEASLVEERGQRAIILNGLFDGSISLLIGDGIDEGRVAVVVDRQESATDVLRFLQNAIEPLMQPERRLLTA